MHKHIIITGASRGIGLETAKYLTDKNCLITIIARSADKLNNLKEYNPDKLIPLELDITNKNAPEVIQNHLDRHQFRIDGLIHNAGLLINKPFEDLSDEDWGRQMNVNLLGPVRLTRELLPHFNENAHILNIGTMGGFQGSSKFPGLSAYSVSKGALTVLTECLAVELADRNISVNCLCLGAVQTEMLEQAFPGLQAPVNPVEMGGFVGNFLLHSHKFFNGKILPISLHDPS